MDNYEKFYDDLSEEEKRYLHELFKMEEEAGTLGENYQRLEKIIFKKRPPTAHEFLDPKNKWLSKRYLDTIYPHVKQDFIDIIDEHKNYFQIVQYGATRIGKSSLARLLILYTIVFIHHLRDPQLYYKVAPSTSLCIYLLAFKFDKTKQLLLKPFFNLLQQSERFVQVKFQDQVPKTQAELGLDYIVYSKAATVGEITLASGLQVVMGNDDPLSIIGADIIQMYISEIAFFIENAGATEEEIFRIYTDGVDRIHATVGNAYLAFIYLDTSANHSESIIEKYIINQLQKDQGPSTPERPGIFFRWNARWEVLPKEKYPLWAETGATFSVCTGNGSIPAHIITEAADETPQSLIVEVPIDLKPAFERNLLKSIKDIAGRPTSSENKLIQHNKLLLQLFDNPILPNVEGLIVADASNSPEKLIWNQIVDKFFIKYDGVNYAIKRAMREPRVIGIDIAHSVKGDLYGIAMIHKEQSIELKEVIYVHDFSFPIGPGEHGINLEAVQQFIIDLIEIGHVPVSHVVFDKFQSVSLEQFLQRRGVETLRQSTDATLDPYLFYLTCLLSKSGLVKAGKNIFLKNNLDSLYRIKEHNKHERIDHTYGKMNNQYFGDWEHSKCGENAKDVSDASCQALYCIHQDEHYPYTIYERENERLSPKPSQKSLNENIKEGVALLHRRYR